MYALPRNKSISFCFSSLSCQHVNGEFHCKVTEWCTQNDWKGKFFLSATMKRGKGEFLLITNAHAMHWDNEPTLSRLGVKATTRVLQTKCALESSASVSKVSDVLVIGLALFVCAVETLDEPCEHIDFTAPAVIMYRWSVLKTDDRDPSQSHDNCPYGTIANPS